MTSISRRLLFGILVVTCQPAFTQEGPQTTSRQPVSSISFEAIPVFKEDTAKAYVHLHYRIREDFFIVLRNSENPIESPFLGRGELAVELLDENGTSVAREIRQVRLKKQTLPRENDDVFDLQGSIALVVPAGMYTVVFSVEDKQSERKFFDRERKVTTRKPFASILDISFPIFVSPSKVVPHELFEALNRGTDILFGDSGGALFSVSRTGNQAPLTISYKLINKPDFEGLEPQEFSGTTIVVLPGIPALAERRGGEETGPSPVVYRIAPASERWKSIFVPLPFEKILPGQSKLSMELTSGQERKDFTITFRAHWLSRPLSLSNLDLAVDALQHIAKDEEISQMRTLSAFRNVNAFFDFWRKRDRDTTTAYNELMAEYYRRVDIAMRLYPSGRENDGYKTDRGRIYILYGPPTNTQRIFSPSDAPREIWTYSSLKRRFIFEDSRKNGTFTLIGTETL